MPRLSDDRAHRQDHDIASTSGVPALDALDDSAWSDDTRPETPTPNLDVPITERWSPLMSTPTMHTAPLTPHAWASSYPPYRTRRYPPPLPRPLALIPRVCSESMIFELAPDQPHKCPRFIRVEQLLSSASAKVAYDLADPDVLQWRLIAGLTAFCPDTVLAADPATGYTAVHHAARTGHVDALGDLLRYGMLCQSRNGLGVARLPDQIGDEPLHACVSNGGGPNALYVASQLLQTGAYVDALSGEGRTALHCAARRGFPRLARLFLAEGADMHALTIADRTSGDVETPVCIAVKHGQTEVLQVLMEEGACVEEDCSQPSLIELRDRDGLDECGLRCLEMLLDQNAR